MMVQEDETHLAQRELLQERLALVSLTEHEVFGDFNPGTREPGRYQGLVGSEVFWVRVESL